jgi:hypothetical protein
MQNRVILHCLKKYFYKHRQANDYWEDDEASDDHGHDREGNDSKEERNWLSNDMARTEPLPLFYSLNRYSEHDER